MSRYHELTKYREFRMPLANRPRCILLLALALLAHGAQPAAAQNTAAQPRAGLVVLIAIDQFRPDYFTRWPGQLHGGLARLHAQSVFFPNAEQDHALTETAPGHSTMLSGRYPAHTGIYANDPGIWDPMVRLIGVGGVDKDGKQRGSSPRRFTGTVLFDWMHLADAQARALSVSRKDRGAIPPLGRARQTILWYAAGRFTTSRTYADTLPNWLNEWNEKLNLNSWAGRPWPLLLADSAYREVDNEAWEDGAGKERTFPHALTTDLTKLPDALEDYPWMDSLTLDIAWKGMRQLHLGQRANGADLLSISLSTTDAVGHKWGPDSRELHDHILRLDRWLGTFLDSLERVAPRGRTIIVVTADHGVSPMPEKLASEGKPGGRINLKPFADSVSKKLAATWGADFGIAVDNGLLMGDAGTFRIRGISMDSVSDALAAHMRTIRGVRRVFTPRTLAAAPASDREAELWRHTIPANLSWLFATVVDPGWIFSDKPEAQHGTLNLESRRVPILVIAPGLSPRVDQRVVRTVDIAPTLAALLGIKPMEPLDGTLLPGITTQKASTR